MTLTIDDGTFEVGNSFATSLEAETYHEVRGYSVWIDGNSEEKEAALIRAFDFLSVQNWKSTTFATSVPIKIKQAQIIGALKELVDSGSLQPDVQTGIKSDSIEGVFETKFFEEGPGTLFTAIENLIRPYINRPGRKTTITRG